MKKQRIKYGLDYKQKLVDEFIAGASSAQEIAEREGLEAAHLYNWKSQLERRAKKERVSELVDEGSTAEAARRILELEEELEDARKLIAVYAMANEFLKKIQTPPEKKSSGYIETKRRWGRSKWRAK